LKKTGFYAKEDSSDHENDDGEDSDSKQQSYEVEMFNAIETLNKERIRQDNIDKRK
jgi:hypothetical protein